jgi:hypothetical protein
MPDNLEKLRQKDGLNFFCPVGHSQHFGEATATLLKKAEQKIESMKNRLASAEEQAEAAKTQAHTPGPSLARKIKNAFNL